MVLWEMGLATRESFSENLRGVCTAQGWELLPSGVNVVHANGRHQLITIEHFESSGLELIRLVSMIGITKELPRERMEQALRANMSLAHGALALNGGDLCMTDTLSLEEADPGEIESAISYLAEWADYYEQILFGIDHH